MANVFCSGFFSKELRGFLARFFLPHEAKETRMYITS
jgi:hypothetical protein